MQWDIGFLSVGFSLFRSSFKTDNRYCVVSTTDLINNSQSAETAKASNMAPKKRGSRSNGGGDLAASTMGGEGVVGVHRGCTRVYTGVYTCHTKCDLTERKTSFQSRLSSFVAHNIYTTTNRTTNVNSYKSISSYYRS